MMTWAEFWGLIEELDGKVSQASCERLVGHLSRRPVPEILGFAEWLAEALYRIDQEKFGLLPVVDLTTREGEPFPQSGDVFLYARCAVVAAGRAVWESVFFDSAKFAPYTATTYDGEPLLYVSDQAYERATGREPQGMTRYCYESYSNPDGWPGLRA